MNIKKYNKKDIKKIITIFIILLIILSSLYFSNPIILAQLKIKSMNNSKLDKNMKIPEYINFVVGLEGNEVLSESITKYYNNFAEKLIPKYYKKCSPMSSDKINKYFDQNQLLIKTELGITEKEQFSKFIDTLKNIKNDSFVLEKYYILDSTVVNRKNTIVAYIGIKYENCEDIYFKTIINKKYQNKTTLIKFDAEIDSDKLEKGLKSLEKIEEEIRNTPSPFTRGAPIK